MEQVHTISLSLCAILSSMRVRVLPLLLLGAYMMCVRVLCQRDILVAGPPNGRCEGSCSATELPPKIHHPHSQDSRVRKTPENRKNAQAVCDMVSADGGWTVFQRRFDGQTDFNRTWQEYRDGFGSPQTEQWFRLTARDYHGDAGKQYSHDGRAFSTFDQDHDRYAAGNCARYYGAGWWFDSCLAANINGRYYHGRYSGITDGIYWGTWYILTDYRTGEIYSFKSAEMKTRPKRS